mgnify:CR=1 FL=1
MKIKEVAVFFIIFGMVIIFNINNVNAALGITPGVMEVDFQPNANFFVNFRVLSVAPDQNLTVYSTGDFAEYVTFDKTNLTGGEGFTAYINLPEKANRPGKNKLFIRVGEVRSTEGGIGARLEVGALIVIKVPYPGKYADISSFSVDNVNENEPVSFNAEVESLGSEPVDVMSNVEVYSNNKIFESLFLGSKTIQNQAKDSFSKVSEKIYKPGVYNATLTVNYGDEKRVLKSDVVFKVGTMLVDIVDWTSKVNKSGIRAFDIEIESKWNNDIRDIYAEVNVTDYNGTSVDFFKTPSVELKKWEKITLKGFFNAENLLEGTYKAKIKLFYDGKITEKIVDVKVLNLEVYSFFMDKKMIMIIGGIAAVMIIIILLVIAVIYFYFKSRKVNLGKYMGIRKK